MVPDRFPLSHDLFSVVDYQFLVVVDLILIVTGSFFLTNDLKIIERDQRNIVHYLFCIVIDQFLVINYQKLVIKYIVTV